MLLIHGWCGHLTRVKVKYYISSAVPLMKIPKEPKHKLYLCLWPVNHLFCCRSSSHFHRERQKNSCKKRRTGQYAACHSHLMSPKREKKKQQQQQQFIVKAQRLGAGRWLFRKPSSNFYIVSQREVSDRLPVISAVPGEEKYRGVVWEGPLTQFAIQLPQKLWERRSSQGQSCNL